MGFEKTVLTWDSGMRENVTAGNVVGRDLNCLLSRERLMGRKRRRQMVMLAVVAVAVANKRQRLDPIPIPALRIESDLERKGWNDDHLVRWCRFTRSEMLRIARACRIGQWNWTSSRDEHSWLEGMVLFLRRLACPCEWDELVETFGRSPGSTSRIFKDVLLRMFPSCEDQMCLHRDHLMNNLERFADATRRKGGEFSQRDTVGHIDGTIRKCCRPTITIGAHAHVAHKNKEGRPSGCSLGIGMEDHEDKNMCRNKQAKAIEESKESNLHVVCN
eukprot:jgi/Bigna1/67790/fgenesh1_pg.4_\